MKLHNITMFYPHPSLNGKCCCFSGELGVFLVRLFVWGVAWICFWLK